MTPATQTSAKVEREAPAPTVAELLVAICAVEIWRELTFAPTYQVSSWGNVRSPRVVLQPAYVKGYPVVSVSLDGEVKNYRVHRLVAFTFIGGPPFEDAIVAHNDGDKKNCRVDNLRWASCRENMADRVRHGSRPKGSDVFGAKLKEADIPVIRERIGNGEGYPSIADDFGVSISTISLIKKGKIWRSATGASWSINP